MLWGDRQHSIWTIPGLKHWRQRRVLFTSLGVSSCVIVLRLAGLLQNWELAALDSLIQIRPSAPTDDRIVIVGIDEPDLRAVGKFPIPDAKIAELIHQITIAQPRAIGLDIYRDLPVEPGHQALRHQLKTNPTLIGIEHIGDKDGPNIPPPPSLPSDRVGFNNIVHDADDKVRRALLYFFVDGQEEARQSFALVLALKYLESEGIMPSQAADHSGALQLGNTVFPRFTSYDGGYTHADYGGYQILLNPRGPANTFRHVSMTEVLEGKIAPEVFRDRIVLIGYTAISMNDFSLTSYSGQLLGAPQALAGVELHANVISQIISATKNERPLIRSWDEPLDWLWILFWAWVAAVISWNVRSLKTSAPALAISLLVVGGVSLAALIQGWWVPVIPPLLAIAGSASVITIHIARSEEELRRSKEFLHTIINTIPDPIYVKDRVHRWIVLNEAFAHLLRQPRADLLERSGYDVFSEQEAETLHYFDEQVFMSGEAHQNEELFTDASGIPHYAEIKRSLHRDAAGNVFLVGIIRDITERKQMEEELKRTAAELIRSNAELQQSASQLNHIANHDSLTGLPNRKLFYERLEHALTWASERQQMVGLLFLDLDGFKQINDSRGHDVGDLLLKAIATRLSSCLRGSDTVSRLGGDEFTVILPAIPSAQDAARVAGKLLNTIAQPLELCGERLVITSSIGISLYPTNAIEVETLVKEADNAMYQAKQQGRSCYQFSTLTRI